ncbi:hypothetical protein I7I50_08682 [Histoplasma capsulatum G186AR]|uniref:Uncharacterized protein n=1 Tax=Ajellomyces capsulatus TaxID=5037 RepID=A0A8H8CZ40_AJECA|nr:hypothetical protein I7I52_06196 [Histoplasma capsulatum]QSS73783.1 hypothetical protein I7I50_08682 [Histoplasma capsulatum G186AR]
MFRCNHKVVFYIYCVECAPATPCGDSQLLNRSVPDGPQHSKWRQKRQQGFKALRSRNQLLRFWLPILRLTCLLAQIRDMRSAEKLSPSYVRKFWAKMKGANLIWKTISPTYIT